MQDRGFMPPLLRQRNITRHGELSHINTIMLSVVMHMTSTMSLCVCVCHSTEHEILDLHKATLTKFLASLHRPFNVIELGAGDGRKVIQVYHIVSYFMY